MTEVTFLDPEKIDCRGEWLFWKEEPSSLFIHSIKFLGQIEPVVVCHSQGKYLLITGYKRVKACKHLKIGVEAKVVKITDPLQMGLVYFYSNLSERVSVKKLLVPFKFFKKHMKQREFEFFLKELKNFFDPRIIHKVKISTDLNRWQEIFEKENLTIELVEYLTLFNNNELDCLRPFFKEIKWSYGNAKNFLKFSLELKNIKKQNLCTIFKDLNLFEVLEKDLSPKNKVETILQILKEARYPTLSSIEKEFQSIKSKVEKGCIWRVDVDRSFETDAIYINAKIKSYNDLKRALSELKQLVESSFYHELKKWQDKRLNLIR